MEEDSHLQASEASSEDEQVFKIVACAVTVLHSFSGLSYCFLSAVYEHFHWLFTYRPIVNLILFTKNTSVESRKWQIRHTSITLGFQRFLALGEPGPKSRAAGDWGLGEFSESEEPLRVPQYPYSGKRYILHLP